MKTTRAVASELGVSVSRLDWLERVHMDPRVFQLGGVRVWSESDKERAREVHLAVAEVPERGVRYE